MITHRIPPLMSRVLQALIYLLFLSIVAYSQTSPDLPRVFQYASQFNQQGNAPGRGASKELVRIQVFADETFGDELFREQQFVSIAADGKFSILVGAATPGGVPLEVFKDGTQRWLKCTRENETSVAAPLVSVPYSYHALVADTISGRSIDAFVTRDELPNAVRSVIQETDLSTAGSTALAVTGSASSKRSAAAQTASQGAAGKTIGELLQSCIDSLPLSGGVCDARSVSTVPVVSATVKSSKPVRILLPSTTISCQVSPCFATTANFALEGFSVTDTTLQAAAGGEILAVAGDKIKYLELFRMFLKGNGVGSRILAIPDWNSSTATDFQNGRYVFHDLSVEDFGAVAFTFGRSAYFFEVKDVIFQRNRGAIKFDRYSEGLIADNSFFYPVSGAQITAVSSSITHIERNTFVNDGRNTDPDILIQPPKDGNDGYMWILGNKFGPENEIARYKIEINNPATVYSASMAIYIHENNFSGMGESQTAIKLRNQISYWSVQNNFFSNVGIAIDDDQPIITGIEFGHSVFRGNRMYLGNGKPVTAFKNGGRGFDLDSGSIPVSEAAGVSNQILQSERQDQWLQNQTKSTCGIDDPFGTQRACRVSRLGNYLSESVQGLVIPGGSTTGTLKFWARSGSLSAVDVALYDYTAGIIVSMTPLSLSQVWHKFTIPFSGFNPQHGLQVLIYPGGSAIKTSGWIDVFAFQFTSAGQDYAVTDANAVNSSIVESRHDERVTFANQIISTLNTGVAPLSVASTTPVANLTLLSDVQLPAIVSPGKIAESALPELTIPGKIQESALPTISSPGIIIDSAIPSNLARLNGPAAFAGAVNAMQLVSSAPQGSSPLLVTSNAKVENLNSDLLDGADWDAPRPIGSVTPNAAKFTRLSATAGVANSSGLQHVRIPSCTTASVNGKQECTAIVTWSLPFADTAYTVTCTQENVGTSSLQVVGVVSKNEAGVVVQLTSYSGQASVGGHLGCIAMHD